MCPSRDDNFDAISTYEGRVVFPGSLDTSKVRPRRILGVSSTFVLRNGPVSSVGPGCRSGPTVGVTVQIIVQNAESSNQ